MCRGFTDPENVTAEVFRRVRESSKSFDLGPMRAEPEEAKRLNILLAWVGKIAFSIGQDEYRDNNRFGSPFDPAVLSEESDPKCPDPLKSLTNMHAEKVLRVRELIETLLSNDERDVLRASMMWYNPDHTRCYLPPKVLRELCERLKTTEVNIRRLRKTAFDRIRAVLEAEFPGSPVAT